ncbi:MAG: hypothetical protein QOH24_2051 [Verrucomicrobiota bacterium]
MIRQNEQHDEQAKGPQDNCESLLSVFRHFHNVAVESGTRLRLFLRDRSATVAHRPALDFFHCVFGDNLEQLLLLP